MKTLKKMYSLLLVAAVSFGMISCDNDNDMPNPPEEVATDVVWGNFTGNVLMVPIEKEEEGNEGLTVMAKVENDTIAFDDFPIKDIILSIVNDEETANKIVEAVGKVNYKIGYKPELSEQKDIVGLTLDPKPLELSVNLPSGNEDEVTTLLVKANIVATGTTGASDFYVVESMNLKFKFIMKEVLIGSKDTDMVTVEGFVPSLFDFNMTEKAK